MNCIHCGSARTKKAGTNRNGTQRNECKDCKKGFTGLGTPKILLFDIETSHVLARIWNTGEQYVRANQITHPWYVLCWSAKWLFEPKTISGVVTPKESLARNDERIVTDIHKLLSQAQIVITQNGDEFDIKRLQWLFIKYGLPANNKYHSIDTLKKSRQIGAPMSHGLDYAGQELGFGGKAPMTEQDWFDAEAGDKKALAKMSSYCSDDVYHLEDWYLILRPWMRTHPNLAKYVEMYQELSPDETKCPRCLNVIHKSKFTGKWRSAASGKLYSSGSCGHCGTQLRIEYQK